MTTGPNRTPGEKRPGGVGLAASKTKLAPVTEADWNFDDVPDKELAVCRLWESARESAFIRDVW